MCEVQGYLDHTKLPPHKDNHRGLARHRPTAGSWKGEAVWDTDEGGAPRLLSQPCPIVPCRCAHGFRV